MSSKRNLILGMPRGSTKQDGMWEQRITCGTENNRVEPVCLGNQYETGPLP